MTMAEAAPHDGTDFHTWWHASGVVNTQTRVDPESVRQSRRYSVQVRRADAEPAAALADSFVYETIPRNGLGRLYSPWDAPGSDTLPASVDDGVTAFESAAGVCMAWTQFLYAVAVEVKIVRRDGVSLGSTSNVVIRPTATRYELSATSDGGILIRVPADTNGRQFSVEFNDDLIEYRSDGRSYVASGGSVVGREPRHALLVFASPFPHEREELVGEFEPLMTPENTTTMVPGPINNGDWGENAVLYFPPGVYWMNQAASGAKPKYGENHLTLHPNTSWVHLAPGAYIKGALQYTSTAPSLQLTGHGVLSGEHYVYQANPTTYYQALKSDGDSLRMVSHYTIAAGQTWHCRGPTIANPPFNTTDFFGDNHACSVRLADYKQVGSYYFQTDGPQLYPHSTASDIFLHVNDDGIKAYHSDVSVTRAIVWKGHNDPVVQMGWTSRDVSGVTIDHLHVIHSRYLKDEMGVPSAIIGASPFYSTTGVDPSKAISLTITNLTSEGPSPALIRITPLQSYRSLQLKHVSFPDGLQTVAGESRVPHAAHGAVEMGLHISNWSVGGEQVSMSNFQSDALGRLNIDVSYWGQWSIDQAEAYELE